MDDLLDVMHLLGQSDDFSYLKRINKNHILNGTALHDQFHKPCIADNIIIAYECPSDGSIQEKNLDDLVKRHAKFIKTITPKISFSASCNIRS